MSNQFNMKLSSSKGNYSIYDLEFYTIIKSLKYWRNYLVKKELILITNYGALKHINRQLKLSHQLTK